MQETVENAKSKFLRNNVSGATNSSMRHSQGSGSFTVVPLVWYHCLCVPLLSIELPSQQNSIQNQWQRDETDTTEERDVLGHEGALVLLLPAPTSIDAITVTLGAHELVLPRVIFDT